MHGQNLIDGRWFDGATPFTTVNPSDLDETVGTYSKVGEDEVREAMAVARRAQRDWAGRTMQFRTDVLRKAGDLLIERSAEIGNLLSREEGKTLAEGIGETIRAGQCFHYAAGDVVRAQGEYYHSMRERMNVLVTREPVGVSRSSRRGTSRLPCPRGKSRARSPMATPSCSSPAAMCPAAPSCWRACWKTPASPPGCSTW